MYNNKILNGKYLANIILDKIKFKIKQTNYPIPPTIVFINILKNIGSILYINNKKIIAESLGIRSQIIRLPENTTKNHLIKVIHDLNQDKNIHGIVVQLPLPKNLQKYTNEILNCISINKDVDGFHFQNLGKLCQNFDKQPFFIPCTPLGIIELLKYNKISLKSKNVVIIGRSLIVGKPTFLLLSNTINNATVTLCHSKTINLSSITKVADILISAVGNPNFINETMIKKNSIIIDVGINRIKNKIVGDVNFNQVINKVQKITPVPGGIGPLTIAMLMKNLYKSYLLSV